MIYLSIKQKISVLSPSGFLFLEKNKVLVKYLISGGTAAAVDLTLLFAFTEVFGWHYLVSATVAFMLAFLVSFFLQKFWTFRDESKNVAGQMLVYLIVGLLNLGINAGLMYLLVERLFLFYVLAQVLAGGVVAIWSFAVYRFFIFRKEKVL